MFRDVNDTRLFVETLGEGPPLLVMHGGLGLDHTYFRPWLDPLASELQLIYYDHRGNGRSAQPTEWSTVEHATWVEDADALRDALGHDRILLLGHSYGGFLALEYALRYPDRLTGLILCSTAPVVDYAERSFAIAAERATPEQLETLASALSGPVADDAAFLAAFRQVIPIYFHAYEPATGEALLRVLRPRAAAFNRSFFHCLPRYDVRERLEEIGVPTLILGGRSDWFPPPEAGPERLAAAMPSAELVMFERSGHFPFIEEPERFLEVLRSWVRENAGVGV